MSKPTRQAFTLVQLVLAVVVMGVVIRVAFHFDADPAPRVSATTPTTAGSKLVLRDGEAPTSQLKERRLRERLHAPPAQRLAPAAPGASPAAHDHLADGQGPLLARVVQRVHPQLSDRQVDELVDTLPPGESPQAIILIPSTEKPEDEGKCRPAPRPIDDVDEDGAEAEASAQDGCK